LCLAFILLSPGLDVAQEFPAVWIVGGLSAFGLWAARRRAIAAGILFGVLAATAISLIVVVLAIMALFGGVM